MEAGACAALAQHDAVEHEQGIGRAHGLLCRAKAWRRIGDRPQAGAFAGLNRPCD
jgi:hypothetical protein